MPKRVVALPFYRPALEEHRYLPECPRVIGESLVWISIQYSADRLQGGLNVLDLGSRENVHHPLPGRPGFFAETATPGLLLIGLERRLVFYDLNRRAVTETLAHVPEDPRVIINDGIAIPGGAIFGTKHLEFSKPIAALYHYDNATRQLRELLCRTDVLQREVPARWTAGGHRHPAENDHRVPLRWRAAPAAADRAAGFPARAARWDATHAGR